MAEGAKSLYLKSSSTATTFSYAGVTQTEIHPTPLVAGPLLTYKLYISTLTDPTSQANSEVQVRLKLLNWDSSSVPTIIFVYQDDPNETLGFANSTSTLYLKRPAVLNQWITSSEDISSIVRSYWGEDFMKDQAIKALSFRAYTKSSGTTEAYFDSISISKSSLTNSQYYQSQENQLALSSTPNLELVPGEELLGTSNLFVLGVPSSSFLTSYGGNNGPQQDILQAHNAGLCWIGTPCRG